MSETRSYDSPLRDRQRAETRQRILDAAIDVLAEEGELTIPVVAERAGVAARTVYFHFGSKAGLFEELSDLLDREIGVWAFPESSDDLVEYSRAFSDAFVDDLRIWRALVASRAGADVRARGRARRLESLRRALGGRLSGLEPDDRLLAAAVIYLQFGAATRLALLDQFGLSAEQAGRGTAWAIRSLLAQLDRSPTGPIE